LAGDQRSGTRGHHLRSRLLAGGVRQRLGAGAVLLLLVCRPRSVARLRSGQAPARSAGRCCRREGPDHRQRRRATILGVFPGHPPRRMAQPGKSAVSLMLVLVTERPMASGSGLCFAFDCLVYLCSVSDHQADVAVDQRVRSEYHQKHRGTHGRREPTRIQNQQFRV